MRNFVPVLFGGLVLALFPLGFIAVSTGPNGYGTPSWHEYVLVAWFVASFALLAVATVAQLVRDRCRRRAASPTGRRRAQRR